MIFDKTSASTKKIFDKTWLVSSELLTKSKTFALASIWLCNARDPYAGTGVRPIAKTGLQAIFTFCCDWLLTFSKDKIGARGNNPKYLRV